MQTTDSRQVEDGDILAHAAAEASKPGADTASQYECPFCVMMRKGGCEEAFKVDCSPSGLSFCNACNMAHQLCMHVSRPKQPADSSCTATADVHRHSWSVERRQTKAKRRWLIVLHRYIVRQGTAPALQQLCLSLVVGLSAPQEQSRGKCRLVLGDLVLLSNMQYIRCLWA